MPSQVLSTTENNFTKGFVTEFTGLNFPENAATDTDNCTYTLVGNVTRRLGINIEDNGQWNTVSPNEAAINGYKWNNAGGDGSVQIVVVQVGTTLYFYRSSSATAATPLSKQLIDTVDILPFATGALNTAIIECQFSDGNGHLFVFHPGCNPFFCSYDAGNITSTLITIEIRDFTGIYETVPVSQRPSALNNSHLYNLTNQGWTQGSPWITTTNDTLVVSLGSKTFTVGAGLPVTLGDIVQLSLVNPSFFPHLDAGTNVMSGTVTAYAGTSMTVNVSGTLAAAGGYSFSPFTVQPNNNGYINTWFAAIGNYPSNADAWWYFKDNTGSFNPGTQVSRVTLNTGPAPKGHYIISAFNQNRTVNSGITGLTTIDTEQRPRVGTWFQGRVWYTGVDDAQAASGTANFYTWTENIYFSQTVTDPIQFGKCYQTNDPTSEILFDLLPTDGGVITIQGCGPIYKLFPIQNGMLVFAANGIWFITGSQGIGFAANDYTITKISSVTALSGTSFVDVLGLPYFWNEEGIYKVSPSKNGGLTVEPITLDTILTFYEAIPENSKRYARGYYHPINYVIQWVYRSTDDGGDVTARYEFDRILNFNTYNKAFFPHSVTGTPKISGIVYVASPGGSDAPDPVLKYLTTQQTASNNFTFSEERDERYLDWFDYDGVGINYDSFFVTGYKVHGQGIKRFQMPYVYFYSNAEIPTAYKIQSLWDYATSGNSGKWSSYQQIFNNKPYFGVIFRRHRLRGQGMVLQIKVTSAEGYPFDIIGWATYENANQGV